jgi:hypothetical protein
MQRFSGPDYHKGVLEYTSAFPVVSAAGRFICRPELDSGSWMLMRVLDAEINSA